MKRFRIFIIALAFLLLFPSLAVPVSADNSSFEYKLVMTDQNNTPVTNPRDLKIGDTLNVEIELINSDSTVHSFFTYGFEFRLFSRGLYFNGNGASFQDDTEVTDQVFLTGDSVGFAYYDMQQEGVEISNPVLAGKWSYTVLDPKEVNITVPVSILYIQGYNDGVELVGNAAVYLDLNGGQIQGTDISGPYQSGTVITLPDVKFHEYKFLGWSDGATLYPAGSEYTVNGYVTLTAQWEDLQKNRQVIWDPNGGEFVKGNPSGLYADGQMVTMPEVKRDGWLFKGWTDATTTYMVGDQYFIDNSKTFVANWEPDENAGQATEPKDPWFTWPDIPEGETKLPSIPGAVWAAFPLGLLLWLLFFLWDRSWVKYSLKDGSIALDYKNDDHNYRVSVILTDEDNNMIMLDQSHRVQREHRLRFIKGKGRPFVAKIDPGKYQGKLIITDGSWREEKECRIKVLDKKLRERKNK